MFVDQSIIYALFLPLIFANREDIFQLQAGNGIISGISYWGIDRPELCCNQTSENSKIIKNFDYFGCISDQNLEVVFEGKIIGRTPTISVVTLNKTEIEGAEKFYSHKDGSFTGYFASWLADDYNIGAIGLIGCRNKLEGSLKHSYFIYPPDYSHRKYDGVLIPKISETVLLHSGKTIDVSIFYDEEILHLPCWITNPQAKVSLYKIFDSFGKRISPPELIEIYNPFQMKPNKVFTIPVPNNGSLNMGGIYLCQASATDIVKYTVTVKGFRVFPNGREVDLGLGETATLKCDSEMPVNFSGFADSPNEKFLTTTFYNNDFNITAEPDKTSKINCANFNYKVSCVSNKTILYNWTVRVNCFQRTFGILNGFLEIEKYDPVRLLQCRARSENPKYLLLPCTHREECKLRQICMLDDHCNLSHDQKPIEQIGSDNRAKQLKRGSIKSGLLRCSTSDETQMLLFFSGFQSSKIFIQSLDGVFQNLPVAEDVIKIEWHNSILPEELYLGQIVGFKCIMKKFYFVELKYKILFQYENGLILDANEYINRTKKSRDWEKLGDPQEDEMSFGTFAREIDSVDIIRIICVGWTRESSSKMEFSQRIKVYESRSPKIFNMMTNLSFLIGERHRKIDCTVASIPPHNVTWLSEDGNILTTFDESYKKSVALEFDVVDDKVEGSYTCIFENRWGATNKTFNIQVIDTSNVIITISVIFGCILIATLLLGSWYICQIRNIKKTGLTEQEIIHFQKGDETTKPYNTDFEIPKEAIQIDFHNLLGEGAFGKVVKGNYDNNGEVVQVAVKMLKPNADAIYLRALLEEVKTIISVGLHENVVKLIGACTKELNIGKVYVVLENCCHGSLESYLKDNNSKFINLIRNGIFQRKSEIEQTIYNNIDPNLGFDTIQLIRWSHEIAKGMDHLESKHVVHSDLAARNILLGSNLVAKVTDFGLSKRLYTDTNYTRKTKVPLPWRWMAVESLTHGTFSSKSDVWMFGVTIWEIFSLGSLPYAGFTWDSQFAEHFSRNIRLTCPEYASSEIYSVMLQCWNPEPEMRPTFQDLGKMLLNLPHAAQGYCDYRD